MIKHLKVLLLTLCLMGVCAPAFAMPSSEQVQQFIQNQPEETDPLAVNAQQAFALSIQNYVSDVEKGELNDIEKQITAIFETPDFATSLQQTVSTVISVDAFEGVTTEEELFAKMEKMTTDDPQLETKLMNAYRQNKYIKQLIPLFLANQDQFQAKDIDQDTFDTLVVAFANMAVQMQALLQEAQ